MAEGQTWSQLLDHHREVVELFEETLARTTQTSEELRERARQMRTYAAQTEVLGHCEAAMALAHRYEHAAAARGTSS